MRNLGRALLATFWGVVHLVIALEFAAIVIVIAWVLGAFAR